MVKKLRPILSVLVLLVFTAIVAFWAGQRTINGIPAEQKKQSEAYFEAKIQRIGQEVPASVVVKRNLHPIAVNSLPGTVTEVSSGMIHEGGKLYAVNEKPVRAVRGSLPFYRTLERSMTGRDVKQLEDFLVSQGFLYAADETYDWYTETAVKNWQKGNGENPTGIVEEGTLVAFPQLPSTFSLGESIRVSAKVNGGEEAVFASDGALKFILVSTPEQKLYFPPGAVVKIEYMEARWKAILTDEVAKGGPSGGISYLLASADEQEICKDTCNRIPIEENFTLPAMVETVPETEGVSIPLTAIEFSGSDEGTVTFIDGKKAKVTVIARSKGIAIVEGISEGDKVKLPQLGAQ